MNMAAYDVARAQVHLQSILNFFRDNDFLLETSTPKDITLDNISRLTNSTSTSTINSSKKSKRLTDIMEESPIAMENVEDEEEEDGQSSPSASITSEATSKSPDDTTTTITTTTTTTGITTMSTSMANYVPRNKLLLKPFSSGGQEMSLVSPPTTPRSPLPPSPLRRTPSPSTETATQKHASSEYQRDSYTPPNSIPSPTRHSPSPVPTPPPVAPVKAPPMAPEKLRLLKALEMRRQKLSGKTIIIIPKVEASQQNNQNHINKEVHEINVNGNGINGNGVNGNANSAAVRASALKSVSLEPKLRGMEVEKAVLEEHKRHISSLEATGRDLLCGWINFQSSTSLVLVPLPCNIPSPHFPQHTLPTSLPSLVLCTDSRL